jgi:hypothetical protein
MGFSISFRDGSRYFLPVLKDSAIAIGDGFAAAPR